jgi:DNA-binding XRE family transcriptional regulator
LGLVHLLGRGYGSSVRAVVVLPGLMASPRSQGQSQRHSKQGAWPQPPSALHSLDRPKASVHYSRIMTLHEWFLGHPMTQTEFGDMLGVEQSTVSRWVRRQNEPGLDMAIKILEITNNKVGLADLIKRGRGVAASG